MALKCCSMNERTRLKQSFRPKDEETFWFLAELQNSPNLTQRELSKNLNISLGKTNYLIRKLIKKGIVEMENFSKSPGKARKARYILTPKGLKEKLSLISYFLKRKEEEYNSLRREWECLRT